MTRSGFIAWLGTPMNLALVATIVTRVIRQLRNEAEVIAIKDLSKDRRVVCLYQRAFPYDLEYRRQAIKDGAGNPRGIMPCRIDYAVWLTRVIAKFGRPALRNCMRTAKQA